MYEKHIHQHRENPDCYEIEYKCLCGNSFNVVGAFRSHIQFCNKKGMLPPEWGNLQKSLKTQDVIQLEINKEKDNTPNNNAERSQTNEPFTTVEEFDDINQKCSTEKFDDCKIINCEKHNSPPSSENNKLIPINTNFNKKSDENFDKRDIECSNKITDSLLTETCPKNFESQAIQLGIDEIKSNEQVKSQQSKSLIKISNIHSDDFNSNEDNCTIVEPENSERGSEDKKESSDSSKICYDYIPCDHLGYVKSQGPKPLENTSGNYEEKNEESSSNYNVVLQLDEKTGLMVSKKILIENEEEENINDNYNCEQEQEMENLQPDDLTMKYHSNEKTKIKLGNSFFTCPFCIVLFPKNSSTLHQFKLHLEYYHPDAALNITISKKNSKNSDDSKRNPVQSYEENKILQKSHFKNTFGHGIRKKTIQKKKKCIELKSNSPSNEYIIENNEDALNETQKKALNTNENNNYFNEDEKENFTGEGKKMENKSNSIDVYWTVNLSVKSSEKIEENEGRSETDNKNITATSFDEENKMADSEQSNDIKIENSELLQDSGLRSIQRLPKGNNNNFKKIKINNQLFITPNKKNDVLEKEGNIALDTSSMNLQQNLFFDNHQNYVINPSKKMNAFNSSEMISKKIGNVSVDMKEDWDNSKDSSWSNVSDSEGMSNKNSNLGEGFTFKPKGTDKLKRESEVWSEFYESLQMAEKLKKTKKKKSILYLEPKAKSSSLKNYSSKRVVKKPKRYRESSESEYSLDENDNSDSDSDFTPAVTGNGSPRLENTTETCDKNNDVKKQKLLNKLENVDHKFVDYLFDLIARKEKCLELYKKHSTLKNNRYSQDLKTYRKKVLNGIKLRGRSLKILRHHDVPNKTDEESQGEKIEFSKDFPLQRTYKKNPDMSDNVKTGEKKRGRPRKIVEPGKLKERRRSDKEVDFIEKNFEREENVCSPTKRKRKLSSKLQYYKKMSSQHDDKDDFSSGQLITNKLPDVNKKFSCAMCKEVFQEQNDFREHIVQHRLEENTYQCMECGECFVVRPSLEKHLHAFHKIKNTERYIIENECCNLKKESNPESESEPLKENQCKVCKDQFERAIDLTKHFRIHGMAFLKEFKKDGKVK